MTPATRRRLAKLLLKFSDQAHQLGDDFPHAWLDGFLNVIGNYETNCDDDNSYDRSEEPAYSNYKKGATAAMGLLKCPVTGREQLRGLRRNQPLTTLTARQLTGEQNKNMSFVLHRTSDGLTGPRFQCDRCGKLIDSPRGALLLWDDDFKEKTKTIDPRIVCGQCHYSDAQGLLSMELDTAVIYLLNSLGMKERDIRQAREIAGLLSSIR